MRPDNDYLISSTGLAYPLRYFGAKVIGLGDAPLEYLTRRGYRQQGITVDHWRLNPRTITFAFELYDDRRQQVWDLRKQLINTLNPALGPVTYRKVFPNGQRRDIQGWLEAGLSLVEADDQGRTVEVGFGLMCPDPTFYDPTTLILNLTSVAISAFVVPFVFPDGAYFGGESQLSGQVDNPGSWRGYPIFEAVGPFQRLYVLNRTTGATFTLGQTVAAGEILRVDLRPGQQSVTRSGENALDEVIAGSIVDWYLAPGMNDLLISGPGITGQSFVRLMFQARYIAL